jgi:hypothetical protein
VWRVIALFSSKCSQFEYYHLISQKLFEIEGKFKLQKCSACLFFFFKFDEKRARTPRWVDLLQNLKYNTKRIKKIKKQNWSKGRPAGHIFGREPSNDYFIKILFLEYYHLISQKLFEIEGKFKLQKCSACQDLQKVSQLKMCDNCVKSYSSWNAFFCWRTAFGYSNNQREATLLQNVK